MKMKKKFSDKDLNDAREFLLDKDGGKNAEHFIGVWSRWLYDKAVNEEEMPNSDKEYRHRFLSFADETGRRTYGDRARLYRAIQYVYAIEGHRAYKAAEERWMRKAKPWDEMTEKEKEDYCDSREFDLGAFGIHIGGEQAEEMARCAEKYHSETVLWALEIQQYVWKNIAMIKEHENAPVHFDEEESVELHRAYERVASWLANAVPDEKGKLVIEINPDEKEKSYIITMK